jgi:hypothetical protein
MAIETLFGPSVADVQELRRLQQEREIAGAGGQFGVFAPLYQAGLRFGNQAVQGVNTLMGAQDPMLKKATDIQSILSQYQDQDLTNADVLTKISKDLAGKGYAAESIGLAQEAVKFRKERKFTTVAPGATVLNEKGEVVYEAPSAEKMVKTPADFAAAGKELGFGVRANIGEYSQQETQAINNLLESRGIKRAEAGVPRSGEVKITDLSVANKLVTDLTGASKDRLNTVNLAKTQLALAKKGEGAALPQLQRQLVKLVGDSQIGQGEVRDALGSSGIVGDTISAVNKFMTGVPTVDKLNSVEQVINALENINAQAFNKGRTQAETVLAEAKLPEGTRKALLPPAYKTAAEKKDSKQGGKFTEGKIYVDAKGNRARYVNGNFVSVE